MLKLQQQPGGWQLVKTIADEPQLRLESRAFVFFGLLGKPIGVTSPNAKTRIFQFFRCFGAQEPIPKPSPGPGIEFPVKNG